MSGVETNSISSASDARAHYGGSPGKSAQDALNGSRVFIRADLDVAYSECSDVDGHAENKAQFQNVSIAAQRRRRRPARRAWRRRPSTPGTDGRNRPSIALMIRHLLAACAPRLSLRLLPPAQNVAAALYAGRRRKHHGKPALRSRRSLLELRRGARRASRSATSCVRVGDRTFADLAGFVAAVRASPSGRAIPFAILRGGAAQTIPVTLTEGAARRSRRSRHRL